MARKSKDRIHHEWFRTVTETTCECGARRTEVWSWGEYVRARWNTVNHFCRRCFPTRSSEEATFA